MSLLPGVERELRRVAGAPPAGGATRGRRRAARRQVGSVLVALAAIGVAVVLLTRLGDAARPTSAPRPPGRAAGRRPAPRSSPGPLRGGVCPLAPAARDLPPHVGCVTVLRADLDADGRSDLVVLYAQLAPRRQRGGFLPRRYVLELVPARGAVSRVGLGLPDVPPALTRVGALDGGPGEQLVVELAYYSSGGVYGIFAVRAGRLVAVTTRLQAGGDSADRAQFSCRTGSPAVVVQRTESLLGPTTFGRWRWTVTTWRWAGTRLHRTQRTRFVRRGLPRIGADAFGAGCGRALGPAAGGG